MNEKPKKKKRHTWLFFILFFLFSVVGVGLMLYPILSARYTESVRSEVHSEYNEIIQEEDTSYLDALWAAAEEYNRKLFNMEIDKLQPAENGYYEQLKLATTDVMAYIHIPKINVTLPVSHGIGEKVLASGCGHVPQSSLPIGGENTHSVISAHTGMATSPMFSDLELLVPGDIFQIEILGQTLTYQIMSQEDIKKVLPHEVSHISIQAGEDLCTLVTCTPFGVNSHRLLVCGHRIPTPETKEEIQQYIQKDNEEQQGSVWTQNYFNTIKYAVIAGGAVLLIGVPLILFFPKKKKRRTDA